MQINLKECFLRHINYLIVDLQNKAFCFSDIERVLAEVESQIEGKQDSILLNLH